jgi:F420-dependent methylenetetrahydromethanopterin dehydrogenase
MNRRWILDPRMKTYRRDIVKVLQAAGAVRGDELYFYQGTDQHLK